MDFEPLPDDLAGAIERAGAALGAFGRVRYTAEIGSTNDAALALALAGEAEGAAVVADAQRTGRGRRGRDWHSPPESGLYLSVIVRPPETPAALTLVTLGAGIAAVRAIGTATGLAVELKWPNDIVVGRPWRKIGGVLCEAATAGSRLQAIVIGFGINLRGRQLPAELTATATTLETELGRPVDRASLLVGVLEGTRDVMQDLHAGRVARVLDVWRSYGAAGLRGCAVHWQDGGRLRTGAAVDVDADGALLVASSGEVVRVVAGDLTWEHQPGRRDAR